MGTTPLSKHVFTTAIPGGAAGAHIVGEFHLDTDATLISVVEATLGDVANLVDLTAEFSVTARQTIDNTAGTATTGDMLIVTWHQPG